MDLQSKRAVVTGGNRGIGRAISSALAEKGAEVAVHFHQDHKKAEEVVERIQQSGARAFMIQGDISSLGQVESMIESVLEHFGGIDILVNNAGISGPNRTLETIGDEEWKRVMAVNLSGIFYCCKAAASELKKNRGKIVNISSIAGKMGGTIGCHYAASKAGVIGLTFALASELAPAVTVNAVAPGPVDTDLISPQDKQRLSRQTPFGRIARPEEIAHTVVYLLENDYVSGEVIDVNAGRYMD